MKLSETVSKIIDMMPESEDDYRKHFGGYHRRRLIDAMFIAAMKYDLKIWINEDNLDMFGEQSTLLQISNNTDSSEDYLINVEKQHVSYAKNKLRKMKIAAL